MANASYDPKRHHRRSIRLKGYDYRGLGAYFVTICSQDRGNLFGEVIDGEMRLNPYGRVAATMWQRIPRHFPHVEVDEWVVMPNHLHGIIVIVDAPAMRRGEAFPEGPSYALGSSSAVSPINDVKPDGECLAPTYGTTGTAAGSLAAIVGNFKSVTARRINTMRKTPGAPVWQRNYYERVTRDEEELNAIRQYIQANPANWEKDEQYPHRT